MSGDLAMSGGLFRLDVVFQSDQTRITRSLQYKLYARRDKLKNYWKFYIDETLISLVGYTQFTVPIVLYFDSCVRSIF